MSGGLGEFVINLFVEIEEYRDGNESDEYEVEPEEVVLKCFLQCSELIRRKYAQCYFSPKLGKPRLPGGYFPPLVERQEKYLYRSQ